MTRADRHLRLETSLPSRDPERGLAQELADPLWLLGRQWRLGEHQGENLSTPVTVAAAAGTASLRPLRGRAALDPTRVSAQAALETGPDDWWTYARRVRVGLAAAAAGWVAPPDADRRGLLLRDPPPPYEDLDGTPDGLALWRRHRHENPAWLSDVPPPPRADPWQPDTFRHRATFPLAGGSLDAEASAGGEVDWWATDRGRPAALADRDLPAVQPTRLRWPGAPHPRIWQVEDPASDIGGHPPDRAHLTGALLVEALTSTSDDWYLVPLKGVRWGELVQLSRFVVTDSFGDVWAGPRVAGEDRPWAPANGEWHLFAVPGLDSRQVMLWPMAVTPLVGEPVEEVSVSMDEDANVVWAVEMRIDGRAVAQAAPEPAPPVLGADGEPALSTPRWRYRPVTDVPTGWHPYTVEETRPELADTPRRYRQGRLASVDPRGRLRLRPLPRAVLLRRGRLHEIAPAALPWGGLRLERRSMLVRDTDGRPVLWVQRRRIPLVSVPTSNLRFDATDPA